MLEENKNESENTNSNNMIKLIMVGDSGTGKTNLISVAAGLEFNSSSLTTTSCSYVQKTIKKGNKEYKVNLWDTIGQEKYRSLTKIFVKDSKIVFFVYDITKRETFNSLIYWKKLIDDILGNVSSKAVIGNKFDLYLEEQVSEKEGKEFAESIGAKFQLTSAKNDPNSIGDLIDIMLDDYIEKNKNTKEKKRNSTKLKKTNNNKKQKCC